MPVESSDRAGGFMKQETANLVRAFLHGLTGAGLFRRLDYSGAPKEFVDSRSLEEIYASGEFEADLPQLRYGVSPSGVK